MISLMTSKGFTVHSQRPYSRQDQAQSISTDCQSNHEKYEFNQSLKYFEIRPSQPRNIENFGENSVDCPKITEDRSSENRVYTPDARLIIATRIMPMRRAWSPRPSISTVPRCEGWNPHPNYSVITKTRLEACVLTSV